MLGEQANVTNPVIQWRLECSPPQMLQVVERKDGLEHGHLNLLPEACALPGVQGHADAGGEDIPAMLVDDDSWVEARLTVHLAHQGGDATLALDNIIKGGGIAVGSIRPVPWSAGVDDPWIALAEHLITYTQALRRRRAHAVHEDIRRLHEPHQYLERFRALQVERDAAFVAI